MVKVASPRGSWVLLLNGLQQQRTADTVKTSNLVVWMEAADFRNGSAKVPPHIPGCVEGTFGRNAKNAPQHQVGPPAAFAFDAAEGGDWIAFDGDHQKLHLGDLSRNGSFAVELWAEFGSLKEGMALIDTRDRSGVGLAVYIGPSAKLKVELTDTDGSTQEFQSAEKALTPGWHHFVVNIDGASDIATLLIEGKLTGSNSTSTLSKQSCFAELSHDLGDIDSHAVFTLGHQSLAGNNLLTPFSGRIATLRIYDRYLTTSEAIANYRAGRMK